MRRAVPPLIGLGSFALVLAIVEALIRIGLINRFIVPLPSEVAASFGRVIVEEDILHRFLLTAWECLAAGILLTVFGVAIGVLLHRVQLFRAEPDIGQRNAHYGPPAPEPVAIRPSAL